MALKSYSGSCHCGAVRFKVDIDLSAGTNRCNCSICSKARSWFVVVKPEQLHIISGADAQTVYQWVPPGQSESHLNYQFCKICGIRAFGVGRDMEEQKFIFVNIAALNDATIDELAKNIRYLDGRSGHYDRQPDDIRLM